jgi:hypothetical protein
MLGVMIDLRRVHDLLLGDPNKTRESVRGDTSLLQLLIQVRDELDLKGWRVLFQSDSSSTGLPIVARKAY